LIYSPFPTITRQHISAELKKVALHLAVVREYKYKKTQKITGISERKTRHVPVAVYEGFINAQEMSKKGLEGGSPWMVPLDSQRAWLDISVDDLV
jgi:hypothetical protein